MPESLTKPDPAKGELDHAYPEILPGGHAVVFTVLPATTQFENAQIAVLDLQTRQWKVLISGGSNAHYAASGHLVYGAAGTLRAVRFDLDRLEVRGDPVPMVERVVTKRTVPSFSVSRNGALVYLAGDIQRDTNRTLVWVDRQGREEPIDVPPRAYAYAHLSPDGTRAALDVRDQQFDIWIWHFARRTLTRLTFDPGPNRGGVWSPDGQRVVFSAARDGSENLYWQAADGTGVPERLTQGPGAQFPNSFSPDGTRLLFTPANPPYDISSVLLQGDHRTEPVLHSSANENNAEISPDGRWLAYQSNESGQEQIYVRPFPNVDGGRWQVSTGGGTRPLWARSGHELFYWVGQGIAGAVPMRLMTVPTQAGTTFAFGTPQVVIEGRYLAPQASRSYDVSPDGQRFLMIKDMAPASSSPPQLVVVLNWLEELKARVPGGR